MTKKKVKSLLFFFIFLYGTVFFYFLRSIENPSAGVKNQVLIISTAACGVEIIDETIVLIKSAIYFSKKKIKFIIFADEIANGTLQTSITALQKTQTNKIQEFGHDFEIRPTQFPNDGIDWKSIFRPCSCQRLFFPSLLAEFDSVLWMDSDTIFLTSPDKIWDEFNQMNSSQVMAMAKEDETPGYYHDGYGIPYYGTTGVNAGITLMNLTRLRQFNFEKLVAEYYLKYKSGIRVGDQDILNSIFHFQPEKLHVLPCHHNYRSSHCKIGNTCKEAEENGVYILHGNGIQFHKYTDRYEPTFNAIFITFENVSPDLNSEMLLHVLNGALHNASDNPRIKARDCKHFPDIFLKALHLYNKEDVFSIYHMFITLIV